MHELGIVMHFVDMIEKKAKENHVEKVLSVTLEVGEVSTVVPSYFRDCYKWVIAKSKYMRECELDLVILEAMSYCRDCRKSYRTVDHGKTCPFCGSKNTYLITGNELNVRNMKVV